MSRLYFAVKYVLTISIFVSAQSLKLSSLDLCYQKGLEAYSGERWSECIVQFEDALHIYKLYKSVNINCRLKCNADLKNGIVEVDIEDLKYYERLFVKRNCLTKCQNDEFEDLKISSDVQEGVLNNMQRKKPYEYLHVCYFQMYLLPKAASAAYTYLVANPEDEIMKNNLKYYTEQPEVDVKEVANLESENFSDLFMIGLKAYKKDNWFDTIANMEEVIADYLQWENRCRVECEQQPLQDSTSEFVLTISNNVASLLYCQQQCQSTLKTLGFKSGIEFLAEVLDYLQISYFHSNNVDKAAEAVSSYLLLNPNYEQMLNNKVIYSSLTKEEAFKDRSDITYYFKRDLYEKKLLSLYFDDNDINNSI